MWNGNVCYIYVIEESADVRTGRCARRGAGRPEWIQCAEEAMGGGADEAVDWSQMGRMYGWSECV